MITKFLFIMYSYFEFQVNCQFWPLLNPVYPKLDLKHFRLVTFVGHQQGKEDGIHLYCRDFRNNTWKAEFLCIICSLQVRPLGLGWLPSN